MSKNKKFLFGKITRVNVVNVDLPSFLSLLLIRYDGLDTYLLLLNSIDNNLYQVHFTIFDGIISISPCSDNDVNLFIDFFISNRWADLIKPNSPFFGTLS